MPPPWASGRQLPSSHGNSGGVGRVHREVAARSAILLPAGTAAGATPSVNAGIDSQLASISAGGLSLNLAAGPDLITSYIELR